MHFIANQERERVAAPSNRRQVAREASGYSRWTHFEPARGCKHRQPEPRRKTENDRKGYKIYLQSMLRKFELDIALFSMCTYGLENQQMNQLLTYKLH